MGLVMNAAEINASALMQAVVEGKENAFHIILDTYVDLVVRTSFRILCDSKDSKNVAMEVFDRIWRKAERYDRSRPLTEWILVLTCKLCRRRDVINRLFRIMDVSPELYNTSPPSLPWEEDYITKQAWEIYCRTSRKLSLRDRVVYTLCELEGLSISQVHYITGLRPSVIIDALQHSRSQMKNHIAYRVYVNSLRRMTACAISPANLKREIIKHL